MRVAIANFGEPGVSTEGSKDFWRSAERPKRPQPLSLFEYPLDWGFHIYGLGLHLMDRGIATEVEFWNYAEGDEKSFHQRGMSYHYVGVLRVNFDNEEDVYSYLDCHGVPDLFINHGRKGVPILRYLSGKCFRVHVPALRFGQEELLNQYAECFLVDDESQLDEKSMLYIPVVNTKRIFPTGAEKTKDFIYLAIAVPGKRHDIVTRAVRGTGLTGHFHPVLPQEVDLTGTQISTSYLNEVDLLRLLNQCRIAVYAGDRTSNPASMWECVAAGLPIVMNKNIRGGRHLVVPGVTGEFAGEENFLGAMCKVLDNLHTYKPREYFEEHWDTVELLDSYIEFFQKHGLVIE